MSEILKPLRDMTEIIRLLASEAISRIAPSTPPDLREYQRYTPSRIEAPAATEEELSGTGTL